MTPHRPELSPTTHKQGLRTVAFIEAGKGVLVLVIAFALITLLRKDIDLQDVAMNILDFLHIDPDRRAAGVLLDIAGRVMDWNPLTVGIISGVYIALRFIESYGLWFARIWAEWLAIVSGGVYLPFEIFELIRRPTPLLWALLITNIIVVLYIAWVRYDEHLHHLQLAARTPSPSAPTSS